MELSQERKAKLSVLENALGVKFNNIALLNQALTHTSYANEFKGAISHNERLEFLGDRVLGLAVATMLCKAFPREAEGSLAQRHTALVCKEAVAEVARHLELDKYFPKDRSGVYSNEINTLVLLLKRVQGQNSEGNYF